MALYWMGFALFVPALSTAGDFSVSPVHVHLSAQHRIATLLITNRQDIPLSVQASVRPWGEEGKESGSAPSTDLIVSPPLFQIAPHEQQILRIGWMTGFPQKSEQDFHLVLHEIPPATKPGFMGLQLVLRMILPVFVAPIDQHAKAHLLATVHWASKDGAFVSVKNVGRIHAIVTRWTIKQGDHPILSHNILDYVLPNSSIRIPITENEPIKQSKSLMVDLSTQQNGRTVEVLSSP